uniref:Phlebovirus glycoprotein G2 fusion domain-containing protein n=1 Tax=Ditylenchus dipsaci TaxID=166011 RepID=A0A915ESF5_9BILA
MYSIRKLEFITCEITYNVAMTTELSREIVNCLLTIKSVTENFELNICGSSKCQAKFGCNCSSFSIGYKSAHDVQSR